jgi:GTP-binding protein EngB required for normal cell division
MRIIGELATALDAINLRAATVLDPDELVDIVDIAERVDERRTDAGDTFIVALAGGTGAGKSSLLNAIAGRAVASVSAVRPHTERPLALTPSPPGYELTAFLDAAGIDDRAEVDDLAELAILDLPDQDSTATSHRKVVWNLLPTVDAIVWVVDPDKYHDASFLGDYVSGLAAYQDQALFVLNKADLLSPEARDEVRADFVGLLEVAGISDPQVFVMAAAPPHQQPFGVAEIKAHLSEQMDAKRVLASKTVADVSRAVSVVARRARVDSGWSVDFDSGWQATRDEAAAALATRDHGAAVASIDSFIMSLVTQVGPTFARKLVEAVPADSIASELAEAVAASPPTSKRSRRRSKNAEPEVPTAELDELVAAPLRELLWDRAYLGATLAAVSVQAAQAQARLTG